MTVVLYSLPVLLITTYLNICSTQNTNQCETATKCGECIQIPNCIWCNEWNPNLKTPQCIDRNSTKWCSDQNVIDPKNKKVIIENNGGHIKPQRMSIDLRKGVPIKLKFTYGRPKNYPVDLYFLMDFTYSMKDHRKTLGKIGRNILKTMQKLTSEIKMGFGSFVDKVTLPYVNIDKVDNPCSQQGITCGRPYSFKNHLSLSEDVEEFSKQVSDPQLSGNIDFPEGGLDALMQVMACREQIGWRNKTYSLIVFSTDDTYHIAGDGKLAGIVEPNDAQCHMENNEYTHGLLQDYPSIGQINAIAKKNNIIIMFAVPNKIYAIYDMLRSKIRDAKIGIVSENSDNIIELLETSYKNIISSVKMQHDFPKEYFNIKLESNCIKASPSKDKSFECININGDDIIEYTATITLKECPTNLTKSVYYFRPNLITDHLSIMVNLHCSCPCKRPGVPNLMAMSSECNGNGILECGACNCDPGKIGRQCECSESDRNYSNTNNKCMNNSTREICSGAGDCKCGQCICYTREDPMEKTNGLLCECDNFSCPRRNGNICSGNGECKCKKCSCYSGWIGDTCACPDNDNACSTNGTVCSDHGECSCGKCECKDNYSGQYCEECRTCVQCSTFRPCVECLAFKDGTFNETECNKNCDYELEITDEYKEGLNSCSYIDDRGCTFSMHYEGIPFENQINYQIFVPKEKSCPLTANTPALVSLIIGTILLAGILFLVGWKAITMHQDRKEYARFLNDKSETKWASENNPMFVKATTNFKNPLYNVK